MSSYSHIRLIFVDIFFLHKTGSLKKKFNIQWVWDFFFFQNFICCLFRLHIVIVLFLRFFTAHILQHVLQQGRLVTFSFYFYQKLYFVMIYFSPLDCWVFVFISILRYHHFFYIKDGAIIKKFLSFTFFYCY